MPTYVTTGSNAISHCQFGQKSSEIAATTVIVGAVTSKNGLDAGRRRKVVEHREGPGVQAVVRHKPAAKPTREIIIAVLH